MAEEVELIVRLERTWPVRLLAMAAHMLPHSLCESIIRRGFCDPYIIAGGRRERIDLSKELGL